MCSSSRAPRTTSVARRASAWTSTGRTAATLRSRLTARRSASSRTSAASPRCWRRAIPFGKDAIVLRDDGLPADPRTDLEWLDWIAAGDTRNYCRNDLLTDWLDLYGESYGLVRDRHLDGYDETFDLGRFLMRQGREFERKLMADLASRYEMLRIATRPDEARSRD